MAQGKVLAVLVEDLSWVWARPFSNSSAPESRWVLETGVSLEASRLSSLVCSAMNNKRPFLKKGGKGSNKDGSADKGLCHQARVRPNDRTELTTKLCSDLQCTVKWCVLMCVP